MPRPGGGPGAAKIPHHTLPPSTPNPRRLRPFPPKQHRSGSTSDSPLPPDGLTNDHFVDHFSSFFRLLFHCWTRANRRRPLRRAGPTHFIFTNEDAPHFQASTRHDAESPSQSFPHPLPPLAPLDVSTPLKHCVDSFNDLSTRINLLHTVVYSVSSSRSYRAAKLRHREPGALDRTRFSANFCSDPERATRLHIWELKVVAALSNNWLPLYGPPCSPLGNPQPFRRPSASSPDHTSKGRQHLSALFDITHTSPRSGF